MNKKEIATHFLHLAASGSVQEAYEKYVHVDFSHHNPYFQGDRTSLLRGMQESTAEFPHKTYQVIRVIEEGELVAVHGWIRLKPQGPQIALVHILRFKDNLIIEEWEVGQKVPISSPNKNGML